MAAAVLVKTVVFDRDLYKPGHMVHRWVTLVTERFTMHARTLAPKRTGELAAGIEGDTAQVGPRQVEGTIASHAPYTMYVLRGTTGPIMTKRAHANPDGAYSQLMGSIDPRTNKFTRRHIKGAERRLFSIPNKGYFLRLPGDEYGPHLITMSVNGQEANNFLLAAWRRTANNHKAIRGKMPAFIMHP
jgi:hypothetical protein